MAPHLVSPSSDLLDALRAVGRVERAALGRGSRRTEGMLVADRWAWRPGGRGLAALQGRPDEGSASLLPAPAVRADAVVVGRLRHAQLRLRAFYLGPDPSSLVVQERRWSRGRPMSSPLGAAGRVQARWRQHAPAGLTVPRVRGAGGGARTVWLHEDLHPGGPVEPTRWTGQVPGVGARLLEAHQALGTASEPVDLEAVTASARQLDELVDDPGLGVGRALAEAGRPRRDWRTSLAGCSGDLVVGWCHGDPVRGNWLQDGDGLVLLDWEMAGWRAVAHDLLKLLTGTPRAGQADLLHTVVDGPAVGWCPGATGRRRVLPWAQQAAVVLALGLARWRSRTAVAERSGRQRELRARLRGQVLLLDELLEH